MRAVAKAKYQKGSPQKTRLVIDLVRGKNVSQALAILKFTNKRAAGSIAKCLRSAIANATYKAEQENIAIDPDDLWIDKCYVDMGPTKNRRRLRPAPQGRAYFERRHYCHITIEVTSDVREEEEEKTYEKRGKKAMAKKSGGGQKKAKAEEKKVEEVVAETEEVKDEPVEAATEETAKVEETVEEKVETATEEKAEETKDEPADETEEKAEESVDSEDSVDEKDNSEEE